MSQQLKARRHAARFCRGWTLTEALVVLSILGVLVAQAVPSMRQLIARQRQEAASSQLQAHLAMTRSSALSRGARVTMSPIAEGWTGGWRIHMDENATGGWEAGEQILAESSAIEGVSISANGPMRRYVSYDPDGQPIQADGAFMAGTWGICAVGVETAKRLVLSATGRVRIEEGRDAACS